MANNEKRSEIRLSKQLTIFIETLGDEFERSAIIICNSLDISANGIQFQIDNIIAVQSVLRICVEFHDHLETLQLVGQVKWAAPEDEHYKIGFEIYDDIHTDVIAWKKLIVHRLNTPEAI